MKLRLITLAVMAASPALVNAAAFDRSGQPITAFFEKGNYAEIGYVAVKPDLPGKEATLFGGQTSDGGSANEYGYTTAAIKFEPQKNVRLAIMYDEPWGTDYSYTTGAAYKGSKATIETQNVTALVGSTLLPNLWVYAGLGFQDFSINATFGGPAFGGLNGYNVSLQDTEVGYVGGIAYEIPDIALRAAVTYRSKIDHKATGTETLGGSVVTSQDTFTTPQSVNINFQTGINPTTLLMLDARWVNFSDVVSSPKLFKQLTSPIKPGGLNALEYDDDAYSVALGLGKKLTNNFSGLVRLTYDTGTGDNSSIFGPYTDRYTLGLGGKYKLNNNVDLSLGVAYSKLGDAKTKTATGTVVSEFNDNDVLAVAGKLGFHF